jgi:hypothetical protein
MGGPAGSTKPTFPVSVIAGAKWYDGGDVNWVDYGGHWARKEEPRSPRNDLWYLIVFNEATGECSPDITLHEVRLGDLLADKGLLDYAGYTDGLDCFGDPLHPTTTALWLLSSHISYNGSTTRVETLYPGARCGPGMARHMRMVAAKYMLGKFIDIDIDSRYPVKWGRP